MCKSNEPKPERTKHHLISGNKNDGAGANGMPGNQGKSNKGSLYFTEHKFINTLAPNDIYIYISYRTANLQTLHFKYLLSRYTY